MLDASTIGVTLMESTRPPRIHRKRLGHRNRGGVDEAAYLRRRQPRRLYSSTAVRQFKLAKAPPLTMTFVDTATATIAASASAFGGALTGISFINRTGGMDPVYTRTLGLTSSDRSYPRTHSAVHKSHCPPRQRTSYRSVTGAAPLPQS